MQCDYGAQKAVISTETRDPAHLLRAQPGVTQHLLVPTPSTFPPTKKRFNVTAYDCGEKNGILQGLATAAGQVVPWNTPAESALPHNPDGIFLQRPW